MAAAIAVFLAGLMVGRTPEYLGTKIGPLENKMIMLCALLAPLIVLPLTAIAVSTKTGLSGLTTNYGPHGLSTILFPIHQASPITARPSVVLMRTPFSITSPPLSRCSPAGLGWAVAAGMVIRVEKGA